MDTCLICGNTDIIALERRTGVPIAQNLLIASRADAMACPTGELRLVRCTACAFVWNAAFDPAKMAYDATYDNDQNFSSRFRSHTERVADLIAHDTTGDDLFVLEVGCGQGSFFPVLDYAFDGRMARVLGFDPAWRGVGAGMSDRASVVGAFFDAVSMNGRDDPDAVVSRHVIEHVPDPLYFLRAIRDASRSGTPVFIETPDVDWILRNRVFFDLYYEHCSLFSPQSIATAFELAGLTVDRVETVFDDQYMVAIGRAAAPGRPASLSPGTYDDLGYVAGRAAYLDRVTAHLREANQRGRTALWGGASKGVTLCLVLDDAAKLIDCAIDINERKQGCFLPVSGIPVVSPRDAWERGVRSVVIVNPAYADEIARSCAEQGLSFALSTVEDA